MSSSTTLADSFETSHQKPILVATLVVQFGRYTDKRAEERVGEFMSSTDRVGQPSLPHHAIGLHPPVARHA